MRKFIFISVVFVLLYKACSAVLTHSVTVPIENTNYTLEYSMAWHTGMRETLTLLSPGPRSSILPKTASYEIYDKPYNSGVSVYRSDDARIYYFGFGFGLYRLNVEEDVFEGGCYQIEIPPINEFGKKLRELELTERDQIDPDGRDLWRYIEQDKTGEKVTQVPSKYYKDLVYLGKFGVIRPPNNRGRGEFVGFVPSNKGAEPRFGLSYSCG